MISVLSLLLTCLLLCAEGVEALLLSCRNTPLI